MGMCKPSGGMNKHGLKQKVENQYGHGKTRIEDEGKMGKENSRIDLYPDEEHQTFKDWIASRWYDPTDVLKTIETEQTMVFRLNTPRCRMIIRING